MENHPIPQDVTGFQFKLIGSMTLRQFAYVAFGVIISVILYYLPISVFIKIILIPLFGGGGILVAFVPVEGRPLDVMMGNFFKAIFSPNQYIYHKTGKSFGFTISDSTSSQINNQHLETQTSIPTQVPLTNQTLDEKEKNFLNSFPAANSQQPMLQQQIQSQPYLNPAPDIRQHPKQQVHNLATDMLKNAGFSHVSDTPNVITGIVKDSRGNVLSGILVEVKDKEGNPVRAFKTNQLGQFISATPLSAGSYSIELEDPKKQHNFDAIQVIANNQIILPIEIISQDAREQLRKELFN